MADQTLLNIDMLTSEALMEFENNLELGGKVDRQYDDYFAKTGAKIGDTLRVREPVRMKSASGRSLQVNNIDEKSHNITVALQEHVAWPFNSADMALTLDDYSERYIKPAVSELASTVDLVGHQLFKKVYNHVGSPGTDPNSTLVWLDAKAKLNQYSVPKDGRLTALYNERGEVSTVEALKGLYNDSKSVSQQYKTGEMRNAMGLNFGMTQNVPRFTTGTATSLGTLSATATSGTTIAITGGTANGTVPAGTVFTVADCYAKNLQSRQETTQLQQFVTLTDVELDGAGAGSLTVAPEIIPTGNYANMSDTGVISGKAAALVSGSTANKRYAQNWVFHPKAMTLVTADMPMVSAPKIARKSDNGLSIRLIQTYDVNSDQEIFRLDILFGWTMLRPEWACRVAGA